MAIIPTLFLLLLQHLTNCEDDDGFIEKFVATSEWAQIKEGQSVPRGLHVRMDLSTGIREAKFISDTDSAEDTGGKVMLQDDNVAGSGVHDGMIQAMEDGLKNIVTSEDSSDTVSGRFRTMEELKKSMPNIAIKTEGHVMQDTIGQLNSTSNQDVASLIIILEQLDDLAHKYDNGKLLVTQGWMTVVGEHLFHDHDEVFKGAVRVMASAAQNNPEVQVHCIEQGYLATLISKILTQSDRIAKSTILAISAFIRGLPAALPEFVSLHGFNTISTKLALSSHEPLQRVILTLYNGLLEQEEHAGLNSVLENFKLASKLLCKKSNDLIVAEETSFDVIEQAVLFYSHVKHLCSQDINDNVRARLKVLQNSQDYDDEELQNTISSILS